MSQKVSKGAVFRRAVAAHNPLAIVGAVNAYSALQAKQTGFQALYLSGSGVAAASYGLPDLGFTTCAHVIEDVRRITAVCDLPLLVDIDTGFGDSTAIMQTITTMEQASVAAIHIEDQVAQKRCGHRSGKAIVSIDEMCSRIDACAQARSDNNMVIMARTDALANEGLDAAIKRCQCYVDAGADMLFPEAFTELAQYEALTSVVDVPVLANITEFGKTPLFSQTELASVGVAIVLYPLSAFRAMSQAALHVYQHIYKTGDQNAAVNAMQTRDELYKTLDYYHYETMADKMLKQLK